MPNPENIIPPKKGEPSRNPHGRGKGVLNLKTILRRWTELYTKATNTITGEMQELSVEDQIVLAQIKKAVDGDTAAYKEIMDGLYDKIPSSIDLNANVQSTNLTKEEFLENLKKFDNEV
jgi:hypothetical protein